MVKNMVMFKVNIFEVKAKLSEYLDRAAGGERIVICRHNKPVAELRAIEDVRMSPRPIGPLPGRPTFEVPPSFFEPLADDELDLWDGAPETASASRAGAGAPEVAESGRSYGSGPSRRSPRRQRK
jgi:prevent-host-death family protein